MLDVVGFCAAARRRRQVATRHVPRPCDVMGPFFCRKLRVFRPAARPVSALCAPALVLVVYSLGRGDNRYTGLRVRSRCTPFRRTWAHRGSRDITTGCEEVKVVEREFVGILEDSIISNLPASSSGGMITPEWYARPGRNRGFKDEGGNVLIVYLISLSLT